MTFAIAGIPIGPGAPVRFIAEVSCNHNGDFDRAVRLIDAAKEAGADFVKFQAYTPSELVALRGDGPAPEPWGSAGWSLRALYEQAMTPPRWFPHLFAHAIARGIVPFASVFGAESLELLESIGCPAYKLASLDVAQKRLLARVTKTGKPVLRSAPFPTAPVGDAFTLYCPPGYPQATIDLYVIRSGGYGGFSYHGTDASVPAQAIVHGAMLIEAHVQLADEPSALEAGVSLTTDAFAALIREARAA